MTNKNEFVFIKQGELKLLFALLFIASLLLNLYFIFSPQSAKDAQAECANAEFVYCINGKCSASKKHLSPQEAEALKRKIELELKKAEKDFQKMRAWHEKIFRDLWW